MCHLTHSSLVKIMACRLVSAKPLPEPILTYCQQVSWERTSVKILIKIETFFAEENAFGIVVCVMLAILFRPECVSRRSVIRENSFLGDFIVIRCLVGSRPSQTSL